MTDPNTTKPRCPYFPVCGGCTSQHIDHKIQLENKRRLIRQKLGYDDIKVFYSDPYEYRNKLEFIFHPKGLGFRKAAAPSQIIDIERCEIAVPRINHLLAEARDFFKEPDKTFLQAVIRATGKGSAMIFVLNENSARIAQAIEQIKAFAEKSSADNVLVSYKRNTEESIPSDHFVVKGSDMLTETLCSREFYFPALGFFQNNTKVAEMMQAHCSKIISKYETKDANLLDLYAGVGTFGIINADRFKKVLIVESVKQAIACAKENIKKNRATEAEAVAIDAAYIKRLKFPGRWFVITDPPRSGMKESTIIKLKSMQPEAIIYVSCNPEQLAKDVKKFTHYDVRSAAIFDMFPQTNHIETVVELVRK